MGVRTDVPFTALARPLTVEGELFRSGGKEMRPARRADELQSRRNVERGGHVVPVRAAVRGKAGEHQAETVQKLRSRAEGAADAGDGRPLAECKRSGNMENFIHLRLFGLRHAPPRVRRERFEIAPRSFRIENAERERRFARTRYACDPDDLVERDVDVDIF